MGTGNGPRAANHAGDVGNHGARLADEPRLTQLLGEQEGPDGIGLQGA